MAKYLNMAAKQAIIRSLLAGLLLGTWMPAFAQVLLDPTRPPPVAGVAVGDPNAASAISLKPVLQSVLISPMRVEAIINGQTVKLADKFGEATVVKITENEVVLRSGKDLQTLKLFPNIEKQPYSGRLGASADSRRQ